MEIVGGIFVVILVLLFFYFIYRLMVGSIMAQIEEAVDKTAPPEVQDKQREEAELEILKAMNKFNQVTYNNGFM